MKLNEKQLIKIIRLLSKEYDLIQRIVESTEGVETNQGVNETFKEELELYLNALEILHQEYLERVKENENQ